MNRDQLRALVVVFVSAVWLIGALVAVWDGHTVLRAATPLMTAVIGWLFTERVTG